MASAKCRPALEKIRLFANSEGLPTSSSGPYPRSARRTGSKDRAHLCQDEVRSADCSRPPRNRSSLGGAPLHLIVAVISAKPSGIRERTRAYRRSPGRSTASQRHRAVVITIRCSIVPRDCPGQGSEERCNPLPVLRRDLWPEPVAEEDLAASCGEYPAVCSFTKTWCRRAGNG
jgi:hypothetical protein